MEQPEQEQLSPDELAMQKAQQFAMVSLEADAVGINGFLSSKNCVGNSSWVWNGYGFIAYKGGLFGLFMASGAGNMDDKFLRLSAKEQAVITFKELRHKSFTSAKTFAFLSAVFVSTECVTESIRGKEDRYNGLISGCVTGAVLSRSG